MSPITYLYCVVRSARRPAAPLPDGMPGGGPVRLLDAGGGLRLVVSSVPAAEYDETALARGLQQLDWVGPRALAHEAVVEHFLRSPAVLPMQLFTLFTSDERALAHVVRDRRRIERILTRLERKHEWGLRLTFDEKAVREAIDSAAGATGGAAYLTRKRDILDVTRGRLADARLAADRVFAGMSRAAASAVRRRSTERAAPGSRLLLDAAFLVPTTGAGGFRKALRRHSRALPDGVAVSLTGPWPPYNFIDAPARPRSTARR